MTPWNNSWYGSHAVARTCLPSEEKQPIRPLDGTSSLRGRGLTSARSTWAGHHTWPGVYLAFVAHGRVGSQVSRPPTKMKHFGRYSSEFGIGLTPVKAATPTQGSAQLAWEARPVGVRGGRV